MELQSSSFVIFYYCHKQWYNKRLLFKKFLNTIILDVLFVFVLFVRFIPCVEQNLVFYILVMFIKFYYVFLSKVLYPMHRVVSTHPLMILLPHIWEKWLFLWLSLLQDGGKVMLLWKKETTSTKECCFSHFLFKLMEEEKAFDRSLLNILWLSSDYESRWK